MYNLVIAIIVIIVIIIWLENTKLAAAVLAISDMWA